jgi:hypothetical protein
VGLLNTEKAQDLIGLDGEAGECTYHLEVFLIGISGVLVVGERLGARWTPLRRRPVRGCVRHDAAFDAAGEAVRLADRDEEVRQVYRDILLLTRVVTQENRLADTLGRSLEEDWW